MSSEDEMEAMMNGTVSRVRIRDGDDDVSLHAGCQSPDREYADDTDSDDNNSDNEILRQVRDQDNQAFAPAQASSAQPGQQGQPARPAQPAQPASSPFRDLSMAKMQEFAHADFISYGNKLIGHFEEMKKLKEANAKRNRARVPKNLIGELNPGAKSIESKNQEIELTTELLREVKHPWEIPFQNMLNERYKPIILSDKQDNGHKDVIAAINKIAFPHPPELTTCNQVAMMLNHVASDFELPRFKCNSEADRRIALEETTEEQKSNLYKLKKEIQSAFNLSMSKISNEMLRYNVSTRLCPFRHFLRGMPESEVDGTDAEDIVTADNMATIPDMVFKLPLIHTRLIQRRKIVQWKSWAGNADKWNGEDAKKVKHLFMELNPDEEAAGALVANVWEQDKQKIRDYLDFFTDEQITELANTVVSY